MKSITEKNNFYWLDLMRGVAAMLVFLSHVRGLYFLDFPDVKHTVGAIVLYFLTGFGHSSVVIFFVLSGFFIIRSIDRAVDNEKWSASMYLIDRLSRLWVVLIPALLLTILIDRIGIYLFPDSFAYLGEIESLKEINPKDKTSLSVLFGNMFFFQTILVPTFGTNAPLWSLSFEFWYYMIFPLMYFVILDKSTYINKIGYTLLFTFLLIFVGHKIALYYIIWMMGGVVYYLYKYKQWPWIRKPTIVLINLVLLIGILTMIRSNKSQLIFNSYTLGISTGLFMLSIIQLDMKLLVVRKFTTFLSNISYTLYLLHMPASVFLVSALVNQRQELNTKNFFLFILICLVITCYAYVFWLIFERRTHTLKEWFKVKILLKCKRIFIND